MGDMADYHNDIEMQMFEDHGEAYDFPTAYRPQRVSGPLHSGSPYTTTKEEQRAWSERMAKHNHHSMDCQGRLDFAVHCDDDEIDVSAMQKPKRKGRRNPNWKAELNESMPTGAGSTNKKGYDRNHIPEVLAQDTPIIDEWGGMGDE